VIRFANVLRRC